MLTIVVGHLGGNLTHGSGYLTNPIQIKEKIQFDPQAPIFAGVINPIFDQRCQSCHNPDKYKGELDLTSYEAMLKGGESGTSIVPGDLNNSEMIRRINLPLDDEDHMPPPDKSQLTIPEITLLTAWVARGADPDVMLSDLGATDTLVVLVEAITQDLVQDESSHDFDFASTKLVARS